MNARRWQWQSNDAEAIISNEIYLRNVNKRKVNEGEKAFVVAANDAKIYFYGISLLLSHAIYTVCDNRVQIFSSNNNVVRAPFSNF